jgi:hypothetical protein
LTERSVAALLDLAAGEMTGEDLDRLSTLIQEANKGGR